jgi:hypothetical protein
MLDAVERWRQQQEPAPTVTDAVRALVGHGLAAQGVKPAAAALVERARKSKPKKVTNTAPPKKVRQRRP